MKWIDLPPIWLAAFLFVAWELRSPAPIVAGQGYLGIVLCVIGVALMAAAVWAFRRHRTTVIPHNTPAALITDGVFHYSRNPIYLGDICVLLGCILYWQAHPLALLLVPAFGWIITRRFIIPEERRMAEKFGTTFASYCDATRRWA